MVHLAQANFQAGHIAVGRKYLDDAILLFQKLLAADPRNTIYRHNLAMCRKPLPTSKKPAAYWVTTHKPRSKKEFIGSSSGSATPK